MFKVGDRVKHVGDDIRVQGKIGTICHDDKTSYNRYDVIFENFDIGHDGSVLDGSHNHWWCGEEGYNKIELLEKPQKFKVGDDEGEKNMNYFEILNIYEDRNIDNYEKEMQEREEKIRQEDEIYKIKEELLKQINTIYENNNIDYKAKLYLPILPETKKKLEKSEKIYKEQCEKLDKVLKEVKAQLSIAPDYETAVKILKKYGVYNKDGKINA